MAVQRKFKEGVTSPTLMTFLYFVILACILVSIVLETMGLGVMAGLTGAYVVVLVSLAAFARSLMWALRRAG